MRWHKGQSPDHPVFHRAQIIKLSRLLDMEYKPSELADEIDISPTMIYKVYIKNGCPHRRESSGQIWIHGTSFASWAQEINRLNKKARFILGENQAWCVHCNAVVDMVDTRRRKIHKNLLMIYGSCAICGGKVNRLASGK